MLQVTAFCHYPSYDPEQEWRDQDWKAFKLVKALKGQTINGYVQFKFGGRWYTLRDNNKDDVLSIFGTLVSNEIRALGVEQPVLVPVPSSDCLEFGVDAKAHRLTDAIQARLPDIEVSHALRWHTPQTKASQGGPRNPDVLIPNLDLQWQLGVRNVILIDDVMTTGGHIRSCARKLRQVGNVADYSVVFSSTEHEPPANMLETTRVDLEAV